MVWKHAWRKTLDAFQNEFQALPRASFTAKMLSLAVAEQHHLGLLTSSQPDAV